MKSASVLGVSVLLLTVQHGSLDFRVAAQAAVQLFEHQRVVVFVCRPDRLFRKVPVGVPGERSRGDWQTFDIRPRP